MVGIRPKGPELRASPMTTALEQYTPKLHQYLRRVLRNPRDIPDIVQETFRRFMSRADRPEIIKDPLAFLLGMARNVARELSYEEQRQVVTFDSELVERQSDALDQASSGAAVEELVAQADIAQALTRLPDAHLAVLMLIDGEGRSYEEAAQLTGFTRSTVATYLMQARAKLRMLLEDDGLGNRDQQDVRK